MPGSACVVEEHKAANGSGARDVEILHRVDVQIVNNKLLATGLKLAADNPILALPEDDIA